VAGTYELIASTTLSSATTGITISSIPQTFSDLRITALIKYQTTTSATLMRFNGDSSADYGYTYLYTNGASLGTSSSGAETRILVDHNQGFGTSYFASYELDMFDYSSTDKRKFGLDKTSYDNYGTGVVSRSARIWGSLSAINSVSIVRNDGNNFAIGTAMAIWGIKRA
jgi:hypothetical protein